METLKNYCDLITQAVEKKLVVPGDEIPHTNESEEKTNESSDENLFDKIRNDTNTPICNENRSENNEEHPEMDLHAPSTSRYIELQTSQDTIQTSILNKSVNESAKKKKKVIRIADSDSENEGEQENVNIDNEENNVVAENGKRNRAFSDSDEERPTMKRTRVLESDED